MARPASGSRSQRRLAIKLRGGAVFGEARNFFRAQPYEETAKRIASVMADIVTNSKARRDYHILEKFEAGIVLKGTEVKALRAGKGQISDAFARVENGEVWLHNAHIDEYSHGNLQNHLPKAPRKLLLHNAEIRKLFELASVKGNALVPLAFYWKNRRVKVSLGVGKGKAHQDKREDMKKRDAERELRRATMHRFKAK